MQTRHVHPIQARGQIGAKQRREVKAATCRMWRSLRGVPMEVRNIVYGFTRGEPRNRRGHLLGQWPAVARACASHGAPLTDVMAPVHEVERELKREIYRRALPPIEEIEAIEANIAVKIQVAEIDGDLRLLREAAREEQLIAEVLEEVADRQLNARSA